MSLAGHQGTSIEKTEELNATRTKED
jgi:hypothetical protein